MSKKNRWLDDDDNDDVEDFDPNKDYLTQVVERKQNNMLESTYRSLQMLEESEKVGAATGEVLFNRFKGESLHQVTIGFYKSNLNLT